MISDRPEEERDGETAVTPPGAAEEAGTSPGLQQLDEGPSITAQEADPDDEGFPPYEG